MTLFYYYKKYIIILFSPLSLAAPDRLLNYSVRSNSPHTPPRDHRNQIYNDNPVNYNINK